MTKPKAAKPVQHTASITLTGEIVQAGTVITPVATEWPKVACKVLVRHNADQATVFTVVAIGPLAEVMLKMKHGRAVKVSGPIKCATGALEVFATSFEKAGGTPVTVSFSLRDMMWGGTPPPTPEEPEDDDDD
jgi:hypothetical protein